VCKVSCPGVLCLPGVTLRAWRVPGVTLRAWRVPGVMLRAWQVLEERIHSLETDADHKTGLQMQMEAERADRHRLEEELAEAAAHIMHLRAQAPLPLLRRDWARPSHICTGTGLTPATSAPGLGFGRGRRGSLHSLRRSARRIRLRCN
jgi:hypothetical protein